MGLAVFLALLPGLLLSGCGLFPAEEEFPAAPVIQGYQTAGYKQVVVMRGDLYRTVKVQCEYMPVKTQSLTFSLAGEYIDGIYVTEGQQVKAGELLARLEQGDLEEQILLQEYTLKSLELQKAHALENQRLEIRRLEVQLSPEDPAYASRRAAIDGKYSQTLEKVEDSLYLERLRMEQLEQARLSRSLFAGMDAVVTYARQVGEGQRSVKNERVVALADMSSAAFTVRGDDAAYFPVGTQVTIIRKDKQFSAVSVDAAQFGLEQPGTDEKPVAYLRLVYPDPTLQDGDTGNITVTLDARTDTLYMDRKAVKTANNRQFVYVLNEDGLKVMRDVTTGLDNGTFIEIVSGLAEGDSVILG